MVFTAFQRTVIQIESWHRSPTLNSLCFGSLLLCFLTALHVRPEQIPFSCKRRRIFIFRFVDHVLLGQVMETVKVTDEFECHRKCIQNNTCKPFNIHPLKSNAVQKTCEMNNQTRQMKPKQCKKKIGSSYHGSVEVRSIRVKF